MSTSVTRMLMLLESLSSPLLLYASPHDTSHFLEVALERWIFLAQLLLRIFLKHEHARTRLQLFQLFLQSIYSPSPTRVISENTSNSTAWRCVSKIRRKSSRGTFTTRFVICFNRTGIPSWHTRQAHSHFLELYSNSLRPVLTIFSFLADCERTQSLSMVGFTYNRIYINSPTIRYVVVFRARVNKIPVKRIIDSVEITKLVQTMENRNSKITSSYPKE